jgi:hypothetical protein
MGEEIWRNLGISAEFLGERMRSSRVHTEKVFVSRWLVGTTECPPDSHLYFWVGRADSRFAALGAFK